VALPVNLGAAGPGNWTVLQVGSGVVSRETNLSNSSGGIFGNVGIQQNGKFKGSGARIYGDLYMGNGSSAKFTGSYVGNRPVTGMTHMGTSATLGSGAYSFTTMADNPQLRLNQARTDAIAASAAASALTKTSALTTINLTNATLTLVPGIYDLNNLKLDNSTLTLSGSGSFVFNISNTFKLTSGKILLAGGATEANVLFNYEGTNTVAFSGGSNTTELHGIVLALNAKVNLSAGLVVGEIIGGRDITISSGAIVQRPTGPAPVPDTASTLVLLFIACSALTLVNRHLPGSRRAI
jgi:choice-of-anchor A domain-containing protein